MSEKSVTYECSSDDIPRIDDFCLFHCVQQHGGIFKKALDCRKTINVMGIFKINVMHCKRMRNW